MHFILIKQKHKIVITSFISNKNMKFVVSFFLP